MSQKINKIKCLVCNTILESKFRWDFQECGCENGSYVDGGTDYQRIGGVDLTKIFVWNYITEKWGNIQLNED